MVKVNKKPAAPPAAASAASVKKRPAGNSWTGFVEDGEVIDDKLTPQQRHVWKKCYSQIPPEVRQAHADARTSGEVGAAKHANTIINSVVPKTAGYGDSIVIDSRVLERFRQVTKAKVNKKSAQGYTYTQIIGPGLLGSDQALQAGLQRGDVQVKIVGSRSFYYMDNECEMNVSTDTRGARVTAYSNSLEEELFDKIMGMDASMVREEWLQIATDQQALTSASSSGIGVDDNVMAHLQQACDACSKTIKAVKILFSQAGSSKSPSMTALLAKAKTCVEKLQFGSMKRMDDLCFADKAALTTSQIKEALVSTARELCELKAAEKEIKALMRVAA